MNAVDQLDVVAYSAVIGAFEASGIVYAAVRGFTEWPRVNGDLDLFVHPSQVAQACEVGVEALESAECDVTGVCNHGDVPVIWGVRRDTPGVVVEIDLAPRTTFAGGDYIDVKGVLARRRYVRGLWTLSAADESVALGVPALLGTPPVRRSKGMRRLDRLRELHDEDPTGVRCAWDEAVGAELGAAVIHVLSTGDLESLDVPARRFRRGRLIANVVRHPMKTIRRVAFVRWTRPLLADCGIWSTVGRAVIPTRSAADPPPWLQWCNRLELRHGAGQRLGGRWLMRQRGSVVCVVGPDGTGKSTVAAEVVGLDPEGVRHQYWRPGLLPLAGALAGREQPEGVNSDPHGHMLNGRVKGICRTLYYFADFAFGYWLLMFPQLIRGRHVVVERGWDDMRVDPRRYRLPSVRMLNLLTPLVPRPDSTVILAPPIGIILERKDELPAREIERQLTEWPRRARSKHATVIVSDTELEKVVAEVKATLL